MAKVSSNVKEVISKLRHKFEDFTGDQSNVNQVGEILHKQIYADTTKGLTYDGDSLGSQTDEKTIKGRKRIAKYNQTSRFYKLRKRNLTITGDLLDKLMYRTEFLRGFFYSGFKVTFFSDDYHKGYKNKDGTTTKGAPIADIFKGQMKTHKIFGLSERARKQIKTLIQRFLRRRLTTK